MTHYISRIALERGNTSISLTELADLFESGHVGHKLAWRAFAQADDDPRSFIFRVDRRTDQIVVMSVSQRPPGDWGGRLDVQSKAYEPSFPKGQRLRFMARVNPVVSKVMEKGARGKRHDALASHLLDLKAGGQQGPFDRGELSQGVGRRWMDARAERHGYRIEQMLVESYESLKFHKQGAKGREVTLSSMDLEGSLVVEDERAFAQMLFQGLGPAKAYGHGMMMVKPS